MADELMIARVIDGGVSFGQLPNGALDALLGRGEDSAVAAVAVSLRMWQAELDRQRLQRPVFLEKEEGPRRVGLRGGGVYSPEVRH